MREEFEFQDRLIDGLANEAMRTPLRTTHPQHARYRQLAGKGWKLPLPAVRISRPALAITLAAFLLAFMVGSGSSLPAHLAGTIVSSITRCTSQGLPGCWQGERRHSPSSSPSPSAQPQPSLTPSPSGSQSSTASPGHPPTMAPPSSPAAPVVPRPNAPPALSPSPTAKASPTPTPTPTSVPEATPTYLFVDTFASDSVGSPPTGWALSGGDEIVQQNGSNHVLATTQPTWHYAVAGQATWTNYALGLGVKMPGPATLRAAVRYHDQSDYYGCGLENGGRLVLGRMQGGIWTELTSTSFPISTTTVYGIDFKASGSSLSCTVNNGPSPVTLTASDSVFSSGQIALVAYGSTQVGPVYAKGQ